jgi:acetylornithine deacetylase/succinyl-diaminopimelate desuccinylase-like protein
MAHATYSSLSARLESGTVNSSNSSLNEHERLAYDLLKEFVETDTTHSSGDTLALANAIANRLKDEGLSKADVHVIEYGGKGNVVARLRSDKPAFKPLLLLAHLDVVEAKREDWTMDPKKLTEEEGYFYGRGVLDVKNEVAIHLTNFLRFHREKSKLSRDLIIAFTADEESGPHNGALHLIRHHPELVDAGLVFNEGGGGVIRDEKFVANTVQTSEKTYQSFSLEITNAGGHSSLPRGDNAIYELAEALVRIKEFEFPVRFNETTKAYFKGMASQEHGERSSRFYGLLKKPPDVKSIEYFRNEPEINARLRTTCVATQLDAGHAENALAHRATAMVNCRVFPGVDVGHVQDVLYSVANVPSMVLTPKWDALFSDASPLDDRIMRPITDITKAMWPEAEVLPTMSTGATDSTFFRNIGVPVYGVSGIFSEFGDNRIHGRDERIRKQSFYEGLEFLYRLTNAAAGSEER